jgi:tRNA-binding protein
MFASWLKHGQFCRDWNDTDRPRECFQRIDEYCAATAIGEFTMTPLKAPVTFDDFARLDIRIGRIVEVQPFPRARNPSYKVGVDVGAGRIMWSSAQITNYQPDELVDSLVVCVCNLGGRNIAGFTSELLILGARDAEGKVIALEPRSQVAVGQAIF